MTPTPTNKEAINPTIQHKMDCAKLYGNLCSCGADHCPFCPMFDDKPEYMNIIDIEPLNPVTKGHRIVIPREHVTDFSENISITSAVMEYAATLAKNINEVNLITSKGRNATQSVFHLHVHLVPRTENDGLLLPWSNQKKI